MPFCPGKTGKFAPAESERQQNDVQPDTSGLLSGSPGDEPLPHYSRKKSVVVPLVAYTSTRRIITRQYAPSLVLIYQLAEIAQDGISRDYQNNDVAYTVTDKDMWQVFAIIFDITELFFRKMKKNSFQFK